MRLMFVFVAFALCINAINVAERDVVYALKLLALAIVAVGVAALTAPYLRDITTRQTKLTRERE